MIRRTFLKAFATTGLIPGRGKRMPFGNAVGEGFVNPGTVVAKKVIVEGSNEGVFVYNGTPALGSLLSSVSSGGTDPYGNVLLNGTASYFQALSNLWYAVQVNGADLVWYTSTSPSAGWTLTVQFTADNNGNFNVNLHSGAVSGVWPQSSAGVTTVAQIVTILKNLGLCT